MSDEDPLWTMTEVAAYSKTPIGTLYQWRSRGGGPPGIRVGRKVLFRRSAVEAWLGEREQQDPLRKRELARKSVR